MKRIEWVDSLKGFGIFCVTLGHLTCNFLMETHIYSFHMFLFFVLSGFLHRDSEGFLAKKTKTLLVPFLFWNIASFFVGLALNESVAETIKEFFLLDGSICWNAPIWFLLLLYMVEISFFFIDKYIKKWKCAVIPILFLIWVFAPRGNIFLKLNILPVCLLFYMVGYVFRQWDNRYGEESGRRTYRILVAALLLGINLIFGVSLNERISFAAGFFGNVIYCSVAAVSGVLFYIVIFKHVRFLSKNKVMSYLGKNTLIILATQYWFFNTYDVISQRLWGESIWQYRNTIKAAVVAVVTIALICAIAEVLKKLSARSLMLKKLCIWAGISIT